MKARENRRAVVIILLLILLMAILLRVFNVGHVLSYDEAWNANSVIDAATGHTGDVFYANFLRHPPLYTGLGVLYAWLTGSGRVGLSLAMEILSVIFACALLVVIFLCGRDWFDERAGLAASFLFAVMPASRVFDTFFKQESLTLLLGFLFLLLFFRKKYIAAGVFLGLAMLTKEISVFMPAGLFVFLLVMRDKKGLLGFARSMVVGVVMSFWWYLLVSSSTGEFAEFFLGRSAESLNWGQPWHYYLGRIPADAGWVALLLAAVGVVFLVRDLSVSGIKAATGGEREPREMALFLLILIVVVYMVLSLSLGKPPWMVYSALPAMALLGGWGVFRLLEVALRKPLVGYALVLLALALALTLTVPVGLGSFMGSADPTYASSLTYQRVAGHVNEREGKDATVMLRVNDFSPNLAFYLDSYKPDSIALFNDETVEGEAEKTVWLLQRGVTPEDVKAYIVLAEPSFVIVRPGFTGADGLDPAVELAGIVNPVKIDNVWVFNGGELRDALLSEEPN